MKAIISFFKLCLATLLVITALVVVVLFLCSFSGVAIVFWVVALVFALPGTIYHFMKLKRKRP